LSQICRQNKDLEGMVHWLQQASAKEFPDALDALGHCYEKGLGIPRDFVAALAHYDRAVQGGSAAAAYRKGELLYKSQRGPANESLICDLLVRTAYAARIDTGMNGNLVKGP
jgi:TPR repeat protein